MFQHNSNLNEMSSFYIKMISFQNIYIFLILVTMTTILTISLSRISHNDSIGKCFMLGLTLSFLIINTKSKNLNQNTQTFQQQINIKQFLYSCLCVLIVITAIIKNKRINFLLGLGLNIFLAAVSILIFNHHLQIINQDHFYSMMTISLLGYSLLFLADFIIFRNININKNKRTNSSNQIENNNTNKNRQFIIVRRKLFHIVPLIIVPLLNYLNTELLNIMLCGSCYVLFNLELIRFTQKQEEQTKQQNKTKQQNQEKQQKKRLEYNNNKLSLTNRQYNIYQTLFKSHLQPLFKWMSDFNNKRQPNFWFTHLFLYLTIILSYQFMENQLKHIGLVLILADGNAAFIGSRYGKIKIYQQKTLQGFISYIITMVLCQILLSYLGQDNHYQHIQLWLIIVSSIATALCELLSGDLDNILCIWVYFGVAFIHTHLF